MKTRIEVDTVDRIVQESIGRPIEAVVPAVIDGLVREYGDAIHVNDDWVFSNAGGIMGTMLVVYCSWNEYIVIWGTPHGTEGHSGRHRAQLWDWVLDGELSVYRENEMRATKYHPGQCSHLPRRVANSSKMPDQGCWLIEYGRGNVASMLPFALMDIVSSTLDWRGFFVTLKVYTQCMMKSLRAKR